MSGPDRVALHENLDKAGLVRPYSWDTRSYVGGYLATDIAVMANPVDIDGALPLG